MKMVAPSKFSNIFTYESLVHAISGASGSCLAMAIFYPLDTVRTCLQAENPKDSGEARSVINVLKDIILNDGIQALYHGICPVLQSLCLSNFVYFYVFHSLKALAVAKAARSDVSYDKNEVNAMKDLLLGSIAGIVNVLLTAPFWVVNARMRTTHRPNAKKILDETKDTENQKDAQLTSNKAYPYRNLISGLIYIARTEGVKTLWSGTIPSLILVSNPALQFMMYELLKRHTITYLLKYQQTRHHIYSDFSNDANICDQVEISSLGYFVIGAIAKTFATVITYPLQLIQTQLRIKSRKKDLQWETQLTDKDSIKIDKNIHDNSTNTNSTTTTTNTNMKYSCDRSSKEANISEAMGMLQVFLEIVQFQGFKGLFRGMGAKILQTVLTTAFMFMAYENINRIVRQSLLQR